MTYSLGIRTNIRPFLEQLLQVFFVGLTIGLQRTVIPVLAETEFGLAQGSMTAIFAFIVSFGLVKGVMNFVSGRISERVGRRKVLIWGWLVALPIPFMILYAPSWGWIVAANVLLGVNQGFAWSMTVTAKMDIVKGSERGLATGFNEFAGYGGVALAGLVTGYLASSFDPRLSLFVFGLIVIVLALAAGYFSFTETLPFARAEAARHTAIAAAGPDARYVKGPDNPTSAQIFALVTWRNPTFMALAQAGSVEKFVDALMWALVPVFMVANGASLIEIGWVTGIYGFVWGGSQLWTGPLSDMFGRKWPTVAGFFLCSGGVLAFPLFASVTAWAVAAAVTGVGMALLYPTLIAAMGDIAHPSWRGSALGVYRFWRDLGYAIGALAMGLVADAAGMLAAGFWFTGLAMALSGLWLVLRMEETHPRSRSTTGPAGETGRQQAQAPLAAEMLPLAELAADPGRLFLIDVREAQDFATIHVAGAVHIPLADLAARAGEIPADKTPVTICGKGGGRSAEGAALLRRLGHPDARWLEGGTNGWLERDR